MLSSSISRAPHQRRNPELQKICIDGSDGFVEMVTKTNNSSVRSEILWIFLFGFFYIDGFSLVWLVEMVRIARCEKLEGGTAVDGGSGTAGLPYGNVVIARGDGDEVGSNEVEGERRQ
ncbi:hypothetical protein L1049_007268 [Liquidambar formosana]|uniref:Uncharacterized protein n=1 Tax=Liquidambar formosana TaxID=63359 RepID=A0AAP0WUS4_LIQFO